MTCRHAVTWRDALQLRLQPQPLPQQLLDQPRRAVTSQPAAILSPRGVRDPQPKQPLTESAVGSRSAGPSGADDAAVPELQGGHMTKSALAKDVAATGASSLKPTAEAVGESGTPPLAASVRAPADVLSNPAEGLDAALLMGSKPSAANHPAALKGKSDTSREVDTKQHLTQDEQLKQAAEIEQAPLPFSSDALHDGANKTPPVDQVPRSSGSSVEPADASLPEMENRFASSAGEIAAAVPKIQGSSSVCFICVQRKQSSSFRTYTLSKSERVLDSAYI